MNYKSQYGQDKFLNENIFKNKIGGTYIDIGAHNGVSLSNTYFFEKDLNWKGMCIEPNPNLFQELEANRSSININGCAWSSNELKKFRLINGYSEMLSGIIDTYDKNHVHRIERECSDKNGTYQDIDINCYEINSLLSNYSLFDIDLLSIDTEGSEIQILKSLDYHLFNIKVIIVENNYREKTLEEFLIRKGFRLHHRIKIDDIYISTN
jgi:FkbM family methyltransferase